MSRSAQMWKGKTMRYCTVNVNNNTWIKEHLLDILQKCQMVFVLMAQMSALHISANYVMQWNDGAIKLIIYMYVGEYAKQSI